MTPVVNLELKRNKIKEIYNLSFEDLETISSKVNDTDMKYIVSLHKKGELENYIDFYMHKIYSDKNVSDTKLENLIDNMYVKKN